MILPAINFKEDPVWFWILLKECICFVPHLSTDIVIEGQIPAGLIPSTKELKM